MIPLLEKRKIADTREVRRGLYFSIVEVADARPPPQRLRGAAASIGLPHQLRTALDLAQSSPQDNTSWAFPFLGEDEQPQEESERKKGNNSRSAEKKNTLPSSLSERT